jgi:carbamoyl-phosphate synthase large subunit
MPRRDDLHSILIIGSGPIVIGQGCEFDYSGTQACKALREEGYRVVLVNSNPATIMTDPAFSDRTYIEPITPEAVRKIIQKERDRGTPIDALLSTLGGQTALNCACALHDEGTLRAFGIEMIGANRDAIYRAEDREEFRAVVQRAGLKQCRARTVTNLDQAWSFLEQIGLPAIIRPAFTLGGTGGGIAYNKEEFEDLVRKGIDASMIGQVLIDESVLGWKEFELEVIRDRNDNCIVVCGIENIDPMGVHTGDSITVAPIMTLTDKEYQRMRDAAFAILREVGVETGGANVQFAVNPKTGEQIVVEMNPRVSRSSALASKATGFPIAKVAAKLAIGYTLDELRNDITGNTSACFEPSIDYVVVKMPRWTFEKFPEADETLTTQMKSVGEAMSIGRTFKEALQKAIRSMEVKRFGLGLDKNDRWLDWKRSANILPLTLGEDRGEGTSGSQTSSLHALVPQPSPSGRGEIDWPIAEETLTRKLSVPSQGRLYYIRYAFKTGWSIDRIYDLTRIDRWFLDQIQQLCEFEDVLCSYARLEDVPRDVLFQAKRLGFSDPQLANLYLGEISTQSILKVRAHRKKLAIEPVYKLVDTCAAEFEAATPYYYSTYETAFDTASPHGTVGCDDEIRITSREKIIILGGGPNRIGQGIEFDYCCVHAAFAARDLGFESVMVNSNPETVSTDYDTSDLLFFEPLTLEDTLNIIERLNGAPLQCDREGTNGTKTGKVHGVIVQFGGQTPLNLAHGLVAGGAPIIGTSLDSIDLAEDRKRFDALLDRLGLYKPPSGIAHNMDAALDIAQRIGYPVLVRPSYVLGGRGMEICPDEKALRHYIQTALTTSELEHAPVLVDKFLDDATEVDMDVVGDYIPGRAGSTDLPGNDGTRQSIVAGIMEHIEQAGIHSGDSTCTLPPWSLPRPLVEEIARIGRLLAAELRVNGLMNVQLAVKDGHIAILEVNPRASRTVPFVGKATHRPWARIAAMVAMGKRLCDLGVGEAKPSSEHARYAVKVSVFVFNKFPGVDIALGPEMRSTGEVMGLDESVEIAFAKGQMASGVVLPLSGTVFVSVRKSDRLAIVAPCHALTQMGFQLVSTSGTAGALAEHGVDARVIQKLEARSRPNIIDLMTDGKVQLIINTPTRTGMLTDEGRIRAAAVRARVPIVTTTTGAAAVVRAIRALRCGGWDVAALQDFFHDTEDDVSMKIRAGRAAVADTSWSQTASLA